MLDKDVARVVKVERLCKAHAAADLGEKDWLGDDMLASFDAGRDRALAAFDAPGAQEKVITLPFGDFPGAAYMGLATTDTFTHGWDLAKATGQPTDIDPELAGQLLQGAQATISDDFRGDEPMPFGPVQQAGPDASAADQLAAFLGRQT